MRYFQFKFWIETDVLREKVKERLKEEGTAIWRDNAVANLNDYFYRELDSDSFAFVYDEEYEDTRFGVFYFEERKTCYEKTYGLIKEILYIKFTAHRVSEETREITMENFYEYVMTAGRKQFTDNFHRYLKHSDLWDYFKLNRNRTEFPFGFSFQEKIISEGEKKVDLLYGEGLRNELNNVEKNKASSEYKGNLVHYIISEKSREAAWDMGEALAINLFRVNRLSSRRIMMISDLSPDLYRQKDLENLIENNYGGVIVIDLSERLGHEPGEYQLVCDYLEKLVKRYRKDCLFIFTYNMDYPGFSYYFLPRLNNYVLPFLIKEGKGDRERAIQYLKELILKAEYAKYAEQAEEFMKEYPRECFYQSDILEAYEKFETWCINKNEVKAYQNCGFDEFFLERDYGTESAYDTLQNMIGLHSVKDKVEKILAADVVEKERKRRRGREYQNKTMHMIFAGNPGTAKTTVARLFARIAKERDILKSGIFVEKAGMDLDGLGCVTRIKKAFFEAKGGVLFIDEAYALVSAPAITTLIQEMENKREEVIVVLGGYRERMEEFLERNEGLKSRLPYLIEFPDYTAEELTEIFKLMLRERKFEVTEEGIKEASYLFEKVCNIDNFGNGRYVRNLIENAIGNQSVRLFSGRENTNEIANEALFLIEKEDIRSLEEGLTEKRTEGSAKKELEEMIGLSNVKKIIRKAIASHKLKKISMEKGIYKEKNSLHMVFTGNPGTAKTTVARLFAEILKEENILSTGNFVEVGRADIIGDHVGATAPLVKKKFREAQGGVLFIDEAYALLDDYKNGFGDEAISTIVAEMENNRDKVIVIFAGYPEPMKDFLQRNPGMLSRIAFQVEFEDYSLEELCEITKLMLKRKQMTISEEAMKKLERNYEEVREKEDYGNGRYVRKCLEEAEMNLAERLSVFGEEELSEELITRLTEKDILIEEDKKEEKRRIGF